MDHPMESQDMLLLAHPEIRAHNPSVQLGIRLISKTFLVFGFQTKDSNNHTRN